MKFLYVLSSSRSTFNFSTQIYQVSQNATLSGSLLVQVFCRSTGSVLQLLSPGFVEEENAFFLDKLPSISVIVTWVVLD